MSDWTAEVRVGTPADDEQRDAFVREHPQGTFFHQSAWERAVEDVFGHQNRDLLAFRGDELVGVLPLMKTPGFLTGSHLLSVPYAVYGGALGKTEDDCQALLESAVQMAERIGVGRLELRYLHDPGPELPGTQLYWTFIRELPENEEDVLKRMPKKARAEARKARTKHGLELSEGRWYVDDLYRLFVKNKHGLGSPALPARFFQALVDHHPDDLHVHLVRRGRHPLAAVMSFTFNDTLVAYYSGTEPGADRSYSASNFMYLALQEWGVRNGYRWFDFGRSRKDAGAFQFKKNQGFEPAPLHYRYHLVRDRGLPRFNPSNPKTAILRETWTRLPVWMVRRMSDPLSRYLS